MNWPDFRFNFVYIGSKNCVQSLGGLEIGAIIIWIIQYSSVQCANYVQFRNKSSKTDSIKIDSPLFRKLIVENWGAKLMEVESYSQITKDLAAKLQAADDLRYAEQIFTAFLIQF